MQKMYPRTNIAPFEVPKDSDAKPVPQIEDAIREFALENTAHIRQRPENATQVAPDADSLIQQVAGVSLSPLKNVILDLQQLHDFLHNEGERIQREISDYLQLSQTAMGSTKNIADNILLWKEKARTGVRTPERSAATEPPDFAAPAPLASPSPSAISPPK
jgi:hypothetical protein